MKTQPSKEQVLASLAQKVNEYLPRSWNCAQTSFLALQEQFELQDGAILKALTPFPGLAARGETCGAVTGCLMALGLVFGRERLDDMPGFLAALAPAGEFCRLFASQHGSTMCGEILAAQLGRKFNLADQKEMAAYIAAGGPEKCLAVVNNAVRFAAKLIMDKA